MKKNNSKSDFSEKNKKIYDRLEQWERKIGVTKEEIADIMGISSKSFYNSRSIGRGIRLESLLRISERFPTLDMNWLLTGKEESRRLDIVSDQAEGYSQEDKMNSIDSKVQKILDLLQNE